MADCLESFEMQTVAKALLAGIAIADELVVSCHIQIDRTEGKYLYYD
jgi:hypothetical protein